METDKGTAEDMAKTKRKARAKRTLRKALTKKPDVWTLLYRLIHEYSEAAIVESWKGGGDPSEYEIKDMRLKIARMELTNHIERIKAEHT
jgi:hypothetical protein